MKGDKVIELLQIRANEGLFAKISWDHKVLSRKSSAEIFNNP